MGVAIRKQGMQYRPERTGLLQPNGNALEIISKPSVFFALKGQLNKNYIMAQSLSKLYVHIIFHTKNPHAPIGNDVKNELYAYIGCVIKDNDSIPVLINGMEDHIHILCVMSKNIALAKLVEEIKRHSSR